MNIKIQTLHFDADQKLEGFINDKLGKLMKRHEDVISAEVTLRLDKAQDMENKITEIRLEVPGSDVFARKQSKTFEAATDTAVEALRRQLKKYKEKKIGR